MGWLAGEPPFRHAETAGISEWHLNYKARSKIGVSKQEVVTVSELIPSALAPVLKAFAQTAVRQASRLQAERKAGRIPADLRLMESIFDQTLGRLREGNVDESWWQNLLHWVGHTYIAPDFLKKPALQEWLSDEEVVNDLKALAKPIVMGGDDSDPETHKRLAKNYSDRTGEAGQLADGPINIVVAVLVAGYIASIPSELQPIAGMFQVLSRQLTEGVDRAEQARLSTLADPIVQRSHTERAEQELFQILSLRVFNSHRSRRIQDLLKQLHDGDLVGASDPVKAKVRYWAARLCAIETETATLAKQLRDELQGSEPGMDLVILDALIAEADGDADQALRLVRDRDHPDARSVFFGLLSRSKGKDAALAWFEQQGNRDHPQFFEPVGWVSWAVCMAEVDKWEEASQRLATLQERWDEMPALAYVEGCINAAMTLPQKWRKGVLDGGVPLFVGMGPNQGAVAESHYSRARACFGFLEERLRNAAVQGLEKDIADWNLWLRLMDPRTQDTNNARDEIGQRMNEGAQAVQLIPFAHTFNIPFDTEPLKNYLESRKAIGGLDDRELQAECFLFAKALPPHEFVNYLEQNRTRLDKVIPLEHLSALHVDALMRDGQPEKAKDVTKKYGNALDPDHADRLNLLIDTHEGKDARTGLEALYRETGNPGDLRNLISHLHGIGDQAALRPLVREQFNMAPTVQHAIDVVNSLGDPSSFATEPIIEFLDENADLVEKSPELQTAKALALFHAGRFVDAREINEELLNQNANQENLRLDLNIAIASGHWERMGEILDRAWDQRSLHSPYDLLGLAQLTGEQDPTPERALQLAKLAAEQAPNDPRILSGAYWLHFKLGRDTEADQDWLGRAFELSSTDEGPIWRVSLRELVTNELPKQQQHLREVEQKWLSGQLPMIWAAGRYNVSLARLLLHFPNQNASQSDGRRREILPIMAGGREPVEIQETWTVGLDVTSIMVLFHLGYLGKALAAFHHVKLAPNLMEHLIQERSEVRFHQPSLIEAAKQVLVLQRRNHLEVASIPPIPPKSTADEVGIQLAGLLKIAREENSKVVCALPIHKDALMEQQADTSAHDDLILPIMDFCKLLYDEGKVTADDYQRTRSFLHRQGQTEYINLPRSVLDGPVYVDGLALRYLLDARILQPIAAAGISIRAHPYVIEEMQALAQEGDTGQVLMGKIEEIRHILRNAFDSGKASFLPRGPGLNKQIQHREIRYEATTSLLAGSARCDVLCIDDRFTNRHLNLTEPDGRIVPIGCVQDVLRFLVTLGSISDLEYWTARHKLRQGGFAFVSLEPDELIHWLKDSRVSNGEFTETMELRGLRQAVARADALNPCDAKEAADLIANSRTACIQAILEIWEDQKLSQDTASNLSDWIWRNLMVAAIPGRDILPQEVYRNWMREMVASRLGTLLLPMPIRSEDRHAQYIDWMDRSLLDPLRPANADRIERALRATREGISAVDIDQSAYGYLFLKGLPEAARGTAIAQDPEFAWQCGYQTERVFSLGPDIHLRETELFAVAREVFATKKEKSLQDIAGKQLSLCLDTQSGSVTIRRSDGEKDSQVMPELALISPNWQTRAAALRDVIGRLGPTGPDLRHLLEIFQTREPTNEELSAIFEELANGVADFQANLVRKINNGLRFSTTDVVPQSICYFERFVGPDPEARVPETYFQEVLIPYRRELLNRDLWLGLDICCLGTLHDDLSPGQWVLEHDDDAIWDALSACHTKSNPFSLLGALDIALYRPNDGRFETFAAEAVAQLSDETFGQESNVDLVRLLQICANLVTNRISLLEGGSGYPSFWKRMSGWMQGGLISRAMAESNFSGDLEKFEEWAVGNTVAAGTYAELVDARREPLVFAGRMTPLALKIEILARLHILRLRHEGEGRRVPRSDDIDRALSRVEQDGLAFALGFPGPLEGHRRPAVPVPQEFGEALEKMVAESTELACLEPLVRACQFFALGPGELGHARKAVKAVADNFEGDLSSVLMYLGSASLVAAANRDPTLANGIAEALVKISPRVSEEEVQLIPTILLQAAAAHEARDAWFKWLEGTLADVAGLLPAPPNKALNTLLTHLDEIEKVLPADAWFHSRARTIALAGAV